MKLFGESGENAVETPTVIGSGFVALDILRPRTVPGTRHFAGGTCGNVLSILAFLGWEAYPIARISDDSAGRVIREDLIVSGVRPDFLNLSPSASPPIVIQTNRRRKNGKPFHTFLLKCPNCRAWFPRFQPVVRSTIKSISDSLPRANVFFFDRLSRGILDLAESLSSSGSLVFFEPSGLGSPELFREGLALSHIIKYSSDRARSFRDYLDREFPGLQIETLGDQGLRFKFKSDWITLPSIPTELVDSSGAGDWFSAGIIDAIGRTGHAGFERLDDGELVSSLRFGQMMASWNCRFEGARGGLYRTHRTEFLSQIPDPAWTDWTNSLNDQHRIPPVHVDSVTCNNCGTELR